MRHYKIVKRTTLATIAIAFLTIVLKLAAVLYLVSVPSNDQTKVKAEDNSQICTSDLPADAYIRYTAPNITVDFTSKYQNRPFEYSIFVIDPNGDTVGSKEGAFRDEPVIGERIIIPIKFTSGDSIRVNIIYTDYRFVEFPCINTTSDDIFLGPVIEHGRISISVNPTSVEVTDNQGNPTPKPIDIQFELVGHDKEYYHLYITSCNGTDWDKKEGTITGETMSVQYTWTPEEPTCPTHDARIKVKTFQIGTTAHTGMDYTTVRLISAANNGTGSGSGGSGSGEGGEGESESGGPIKIGSDEPIEIGGLNIKIPKLAGASGSGIGTVVNIVYGIILYIIGGLAIIGILIGGIQFITSNGNSDQAAKAKKTILYSIVGIIIAILSIVITNVIINII